MWAKVVEKIKTSSVKNVVPFGASKMLSAPYDVVKPERVPGGGRRFRIIAHRKADEQILLEAHIRELIALLNGFTATTARGTHNSLKYEDYSDIAPVSIDGTISMEASFLMPTRTF